VTKLLADMSVACDVTFCRVMAGEMKLDARPNGESRRETRVSRAQQPETFSGRLKTKEQIMYHL
jgi:hypothetical protein